MAQDDRCFLGLWSACFLKVIPSHSCFTAPCLKHICLHTSPQFFRYLQPVSSAPPSLPHPSTGPPTENPQGGLYNLLSQVTSPKLSSKSAVATLRLSYLQEKGSFDTNIDDLTTTLDACEENDTTDVGRLTSPRFSQEREVSANPFGASCIQTHSSVERSKRSVEPFPSVEPCSSFQKPLSKGKRNRDVESVQDSLK